MTILQITPDFAQAFADFVYLTSGCHSIVCDTWGKIIGDSARTRIGVIHAGSKKINETPGMTEIAVTAAEAAANPAMKEGMNYAIIVDGKKIGTYGIAGKLELVQPLVKLAAAIISNRLLEIEQKASLEKVIGTVAQNVDRAAAAVQMIQIAAEELVTTTNAAVELSQTASSKVEDTGQIVDLSRNIAMQTKLMGLNASTEAARAGIHGRSFAILAVEMQKLAQSSSESTIKTKKILSEIQQAINHVIGCIQQLATISASQTQAMQDIVKMIDEVRSSTAELISIFR